MDPLATRRSLALLVGGAVLALAVWAALHFDLASFDAERLAEQVRSTGAWGPGVLVLLLIVQSIAVPLPSQPLLMAAGFVYGGTFGFGIGWLGVLAGACTCFALARALGRPFVERFTRRERLAAIDDYVAHRGLRTAFLTILSLRLFAHVSFDVVSYASGLIRIPFHWFVVATAVGEIPKVLLLTWLGDGLGEAPAWVSWLIAAGILGIFVFGFLKWISRRAVRPA